MLESLAERQGALEDSLREVAALVQRMEGAQKQFFGNFGKMTVTPNNGSSVNLREGNRHKPTGFHLQRNRGPRAAEQNSIAVSEH